MSSNLLPAGARILSISLKEKMDFKCMITFKNKVALVTGGGTGVGRAACMKLAEYGAYVLVDYAHSHEEALETVQMITKNGGNAAAIRADISKNPEVSEMILEAQDQFGGVHYLVNNAGITEQLDLADLKGVTDEMWERLFSVNVKGRILLRPCRGPIHENTDRVFDS